MARSVKFSKRFPFAPKAKPSSEVVYAAGREYHNLTNEAADAAVAGGYGEEIAHPQTREEMAAATKATTTGEGAGGKTKA